VSSAPASPLATTSAVASATFQINGLDWERRAPSTMLTLALASDARTAPIPPTVGEIWPLTVSADEAGTFGLLRP
jgi:hypothetical protein